MFEKTRLFGRIRDGIAIAPLVLAMFGCSAPEELEKRAQVAQIRQRMVTGQPVVLSVLVDEAAPRQAQSEVRRALGGTGSRVIHNFTTGPGMSIEVASEADLESVADQPGVIRLEPTAAGVGSLTESRAIVGADSVYADGLDGQGTTVAILDSGIDQTHSDLSDDLVDEACICNTGPACCPNGTSMQFGPGAAPDDVGHGTHVSGIVTSAGNIAPRGISPDSGVVMVRMMNNNVFSSSDDITASLEWVLDNHPEVASVNLSLQTNATFQANCDIQTSSYTPPTFIVNMANAVQALRDVGITTVAAAGNHGSKSSMSAPGCLSNVLSVGNTTKENQINASSNSTESLDILAPGTSILSTFLNDSTAFFTGTSMSSPHVAAAVALLQQSEPTLLPNDVDTCLGASPTELTDVNGITRPLLHLPSAVSACSEGPGPECNSATIEAENMNHSVGGPASQGWNIWSNGDISATHDFTPGPTSITVRARGQSAAGVASHMVVRVGGVVVGDVSVTSSTFADYEFEFIASAGPQLISIAFDNDYYAPPEDRNLIVDNVTIACIEPASQLSGELLLHTEWGGGYCMGLLLTNTGTDPTETWQVVIDTHDGMLTDRWNANFSATSGQVTLTPLSWNRVIDPQQTNSSVGFCASRPAGSNQVATLSSVTSL